MPKEKSDSLIYETFSSISRRQIELYNINLQFKFCFFYSNFLPIFHQFANMLTSTFKLNCFCLFFLCKYSLTMSTFEIADEADNNNNNNQP